jgi:hypothetical protein
MVKTLVHPNKTADLVFSVPASPPCIPWAVLFSIPVMEKINEGPQEVICFIEAFSNSIDLMNQILHVEEEV